MNNVTPYEVSHNLVEKRVQGSVLMEQQMQAIASTKKSMIDKPSVMRVITNRMIQEKDRDQFYGPNLPVAWGNDLVPPRMKKLAGISDLENEDDDAEDSPTEDVSQCNV